MLELHLVERTGSLISSSSSLLPLMESNSEARHSVLLVLDVCQAEQEGDKLMMQSYRISNVC